MLPITSADLTVLSVRKPNLRTLKNAKSWKTGTALVVSAITVRAALTAHGATLHDPVERRSWIRTQTGNVVDVVS